MSNSKKGTVQVVIDDAQRAVNDLARYIDAAQALENYIVSLVAGPCRRVPRDTPLGQAAESCIGYSSANLRPEPRTDVPKKDVTLNNTRVIVYAKTAGQDNLTWYYVEIQEDGNTHNGTRGWVGIEPSNLSCDSNSIPEVGPDFDPEKACSSSIACAGSESGCVKICDIALIQGGLKIRTHPGAAYTFAGEEIVGREVGNLSSGIFIYDAVQADIDGCWYRLVADSGKGYWVKGSVRVAAEAYQYYLVPMKDCSGARKLTNSDFYSAFQQPDFKPVPCAKDPSKIYPYDQKQSVEDKIAFILQCESGGDNTSAISIANVIYNRMIAMARTALDIVQDGEWACLCTDQDHTPSTLVKDLAHTLAGLDTSNPLNIGPLNVPPNKDVPLHIDRALYTAGVPIPPGGLDITDPRINDPYSEIVGSILGQVYDSWLTDTAFDKTGCAEFYDKATATQNLRSIYIGVTHKQDSQYMTVYFTNFPLNLICNQFNQE